MTKLWKNGRFIADRFAPLDDAAPLETVSFPIVSLERWRAEQSALQAGTREIGVLLEPAAVLDPATDAFARVALVVIPFAKFTDGRGYTLARRLREELGFTGEIRATGEVLSDQIPLMLRCGFDAFAVSHAPTLRALEAGRIPAIAEIYQPATRGRADGATLFLTRHARVEAA